MSRLEIDRSKCTIFVINADHVKLQSWVEVFDCEVGSFPTYYPGFLWGQSENLSFRDPICEKVLTRLAVWKRGILFVARSYLKFHVGNNLI